jgi:Flp pilus assembly protein TadB
MDRNQEWYEGINKQISVHENQLGSLGQREWNLPLLKRISERVDDFSKECKECQGIKRQLEEISRYLVLQQGIVKQEFSKYQSCIQKMTNHLKHQHKLIGEKQYVKRFVLTSFILGVILIILGYILLYFGITVLAMSITIPALFGRMFLSYIIGSLLDSRAMKKGRVI